MTSAVVKNKSFNKKILEKKEGSWYKAPVIIYTDANKRNNVAVKIYFGCQK